VRAWLLPLAAALALAPRPGVAGTRQAVPAEALPPVPGPSPADSVLDANTAALSGELRCPVCQGNSLQDSPSEMAAEMRSLIRDQLRSGKTPDEVRAYFVSKYGEWVLLQPKAQGLNLIVYLAPLAALLVGGAVVWRSVRRWSAPTHDSANA
jgi:cytochrome c-type biogenesis protein CcmH